MFYLEGEFGISIIRFLQSGIAGEALWYILMPFHYLGSELGYLTLLPVIYWSIDKKLGKDLLILSLFSTVISFILKVWWARPRPFHVAPDTIKPLEHTTEFGLPSGHTIFGTILGLSFLKVSRTRIQSLLAILVVFLMGLSRMVHGMHFLQDVLAGLLLGALFFYSYHKLKYFITSRCSSTSLFIQIIVTLAFALLAFLLVIITNSETEMRKSLLSPLGAVFGGIIGFSMETGFFKFVDSRKVKINVLRSITGLVTTALLYVLLDVGYYKLVAEIDSPGEFLLYMIRYGIVGCWVAAGSPYLFKLFKI